MKFKKDSLICREGEESNNIYIVNKGLIACEMTYQPKSFKTDSQARKLTDGMNSQE